MGYSKILSWEVINFMSFEKARVEFDETGMINIKGFNDSGKSAMLRALAVCLMDKYKSKQAKFIRDDKEYFRIIVNFEDGVSIIRDKYRNGQSLYEMYSNGKCIFTTKQGSKLSKIDGVPKPIEDYLGLCVTNSTFLNYQTNEEKLPVADTTGSENYQMFHEVLRMEEMYRANNMINTDKNELGSKITEIEYDLQRDEVLLERCGDVSKELIDVLEQLDKESDKTNAKRVELQTVGNVIKNYESIKEIPSVEKLSVDRLVSLEKIKDSISKMDSTPNIPNINKIETNRVQKLEEIRYVVDKLSSFVSIPEVQKVDVTLVDRRNKLANTIKVFNDYYKCLKVCKELESDLVGAKSSLDSLIESMKEQGIELVKCVKCGEYTPVGGHVHE